MEKLEESFKEICKYFSNEEEKSLSALDEHDLYSFAGNFYEEIPYPIRGMKKNYPFEHGTFILYASDGPILLPYVYKLDKSGDSYVKQLLISYMAHMTVEDVDTIQSIQQKLTRAQKTLDCLEKSQRVRQLFMHEQ